MAQVESSMEKNVTAEEVCPYPRAATNLRISGGKLNTLEGR